MEKATDKKDNQILPIDQAIFFLNKKNERNCKYTQTRFGRQ